MRVGGSITADKLLDRYVNNRICLETQEEKDAVRALLHQAVMRPCSSEIAITMVLKFGAYAREPLIQLLPHTKMKIAFLYGDMDWMDREPADKLIYKKMLQSGCQVSTVPNAGHNLLIDNPTFSALQIMLFVQGPQIKTAYSKKQARYMESREERFREVREGGDGQAD